MYEYKEEEALTQETGDAVNVTTTETNIFLIAMTLASKQIEDTIYIVVQ